MPFPLLSYKHFRPTYPLPPFFHPCRYGVPVSYQGGGSMKTAPFSVIRYPGGKRRMLDYLLRHLPTQTQIERRYVEPFAGSAAVFFALEPERPVLADKNPELIELYRGIQADPDAVWDLYQAFLPTK